MAKPDPLENRHPVDRLKDVRDEIKRLGEVEDYIKRMILSGKFDLSGDEWDAVITAGTQKRLDRDALGKVVDLSEFMHDIEFKTIRIVKKKKAEAEPEAAEW